LSRIKAISDEEVKVEDAIKLDYFDTTNAASKKRRDQQLVVMQRVPNFKSVVMTNGNLWLDQWRHAYGAKFDSKHKQGMRTATMFMRVQDTFVLGDGVTIDGRGTGFSRGMRSPSGHCHAGGNGAVLSLVFSVLTEITLEDAVEFHGFAQLEALASVRPMAFISGVHFLTSWHCKFRPTPEGESPNVEYYGNDNPKNARCSVCTIDSAMLELGALVAAVARSLVCTMDSAMLESWVHRVAAVAWSSFCDGICSQECHWFPHLLV
jgi:hypothetical protein